MKKRLLALTAAAVAMATFGLSAPAFAGGYVKQGSYGWNDQCLGVGYNGVVNHTWTSYYCDTIFPSGATGPGLYNLYVAY
jgi:hypothetical protein